MSFRNDTANLIRIFLFPIIVVNFSKKIKNWGLNQTISKSQQMLLIANRLRQAQPIVNVLKSGMLGTSTAI